jgi:effector-binding domain-containing protein
MYEIEENATLEMTNVLSYRGKATQNKLSQISKEIEEMLKDNNAHKNGASVTATFAIDTSSPEPMLDIELLIPIDKNIIVSQPYVIKPLFRLKNAVKIRHIGNPALLQQTANELMEYIKAKKLIPITAGYNVTVQEPTSQINIGDMIVDIYVGVSDNIL